MDIEPKDLFLGAWIRLKDIECIKKDASFISDYNQSSGEEKIFCHKNDDIFINEEMLSNAGSVFQISFLYTNKKAFNIAGDINCWTYPYEMIAEIVETPFKNIELTIDDIFNGLTKELC